MHTLLTSRSPQPSARRTGLLARPALTLLLAAALAAAGCASSTPQSRINKGRSAFESWPEEVQRQVRKGEVAVGFTPAQVEMALGKPDRVSERTSDRGASEVWSYRDREPRVGFGFGIGGGSGGTSMGTSVGVSSGGRQEEKLRVIFEGGAVSAIERVR